MSNLAWAKDKYPACNIQEKIRHSILSKQQDCQDVKIEDLKKVKTLHISSKGVTELRDQDFEHLTVLVPIRSGNT